MIFKPLAGLPFIAPPNTAIHCPDATIIHPHPPIICSPLASLLPVVHATWTRIPSLNLALLTSANPRHSTSPTGDAHCSPGIFHSASGIVRHLVSCHSLPAIASFYPSRSFISWPATVLLSSACARPLFPISRCFIHRPRGTSPCHTHFHVTHSSMKVPRLTHGCHFVLRNLLPSSRGSACGTPATPSPVDQRPVQLSTHTQFFHRSTVVSPGPPFLCHSCLHLTPELSQSYWMPSTHFSKLPHAVGSSTELAFIPLPLRYHVVLHPPHDIRFPVHSYVP